MKAETDHWTLDKRIPLALIMALLGQCVVAVWWARGFVSEQQAHEKRLTALEQSRERERVGERLATLENQMQNATTLLQRIDDRTERLVVPGRKSDR